jgi:tetratricopeptide (TPR) repeat protein
LISKIGSYLQIVAKDPSSTAFVPLAEAYRQIGLLDDALEAARLGTKMLPHFSPGFSTLGRILGQMGKIDEAMSAYARAFSIDRQSQAALVGIARLHLIRGERDMARKILRQAEEFHPDDEKISDMLNALDLPRPWEEIKQASELQAVVPEGEDTAEESGEPIPTATLAEIYVKQGLIDKALKVYRDILEQSPDNTVAQERMQQLQEQPEAQTETLTEESPAKIDGTEDAQKAVEAEEPPVSSKLSPQIPSGPRDQSPLAVFQRWLGAIKHGRANV